MKPKVLPLLAAAACILSPAASQASLLIYEGFNGYANNTVFTGVTPNANTTGLDQTVAYSGSGAGTFKTFNAGLTFSNLQTSGGSATSTTASSVVAPKLSSTFTSYTGTLYSSYLVSINTFGAASGDGFEMRISDNNSTGGTGGNSRFRSLADSRSSTSNLVATDYVTLAAGGGTIANAASGVPLTVNQTFLIVGVFTNVGTTFTASNQGTAKTYAFTTDQFNFMMGQADPAAYLAGLSNANIGTAFNNVWAYATENGGAVDGIYTLDSGDFVNMVSVGDVATIDELRFGSDLASVVPIPEPSAALLSAGAVLGAALRRRRNRV